jgi:hydroxypyruvate isomerase
MRRRDLLANTAAVAAPVLLSESALAQGEQKAARKGRLKQGVCGGVFGPDMPFEDRCRHAARLGAQCFDLQNAKNWPILKKYGLVPTVTPGGGKLTDACNDRTLHDAIEKQFRENLEAAAKEGVPNVITFSGNRRGKSDSEGMDACYDILKKVVPIAEDKGVTICMELLNSRVDHPDYQCDKSAWGIELCKRVNSPRFKLLFDIYHMQIMEGDIIRSIRNNLQWFGHFHTAGNPGRNEITGPSELNYTHIAQALVDLGYQGYMSHEYSPRRDPQTRKPLQDPLMLLDAALAACDV